VTLAHWLASEVEVAPDGIALDEQTSMQITAVLVKTQHFGST
jgi:hypothetical protein